MNIICKICYDNNEHFAVPRDKIGEVLIEEHFKNKHPEAYQKYLEGKK